MKKQQQSQKKNTSIKLLAKKALRNKPKHIPAKGYKYLKNLKLGSLFSTGSGMRGVLISCDHDATVIITETYKSGELGKMNISSDTEVKEIIEV
jgi:hypothetical protein